MSERNEVLDTVLRELEVYGLKGILTYGGKHIRVDWAYPNGRSRFTTCPRTPSDHRSSLNARAQVRRMLKEDGAQIPTPQQRMTLERALQLPPPVEQPTDRIKRLEDDVAGLLDMLAEAQEQVQQLTQKMSTARVEARIVFDAPPVAETVVPPPVKAQRAAKPKAVHEKGEGGYRKGTLYDRVLSALSTGAYTHTDTICEQVGTDKHTLSTYLYNLGKKRLVERGNVAGWWRKRYVNGEAKTEQ